MLQTSRLRSFARGAFFSLWIQYGYTEPNVISLGSVPTSACVGKAGAGSATFSSEYPGNTGEVLNIWPAGYNGQSGAQWTIWTNTSNTEFDGVGVPGAGAGFGDSESAATALEKLLKLNPDGRSFNMNITDKDTWDQQIIVSVLQTSNSTKKRYFIPRGIASSKPIASHTNTSKPTHPSTGKSASTGIATSISKNSTSSTATAVSPTTAYVVTVTGTWACSLGPGLGPTPFPVNTASPAVSSRCEANLIPMNTAAWSQYNASSYLSSLIAKQTNSPSQPFQDIAGYKIVSHQVDIGSLLKTDLSLSNDCSLTENCELIKCQDVRGNTPEDASNPARFLAYNSYVNLSNLLYQYWRAITIANVAELNSQDAFVKTFFTNTPPDVLWQKITGAIAPSFSLAATLMGLFKDFIPAPVILITQITSGILYDAGGIANSAQDAPVLEQSFDAAAALGTAVQQYVNNMTESISAVYKNLITNVDGDAWLQISNNGSGLAAMDTPDDLSTTIINNVTSIFYMKSINWVMRDNSVFLIWVPYGAPFSTRDANDQTKVLKNFDNFSEDDCTANFQGGKNGTVFTVCDAGSLTKGMARIYQLTNQVKSNTYTSAVQGWDSAFPIPGGWNFDLPSVIRGSVNSWQVGGFNYDLDKVTGDDQTSLLNNFQSTPEQPGIFTLPVCANLGTYKMNDGGKTNWLAPFPDAVMDSKGDTRYFAQCSYGLEYLNGTTGEPAWFGPGFSESAPTTDLQQASNYTSGD